MSLMEKLKKKLLDDIETMTKSDADDIPDLKQEDKEESGEKIKQKAILTDPFYDRSATSFSLTRNKITRLSNRTLREITMRDWLVNTILQIRCDTILRFSKVQERRFDMGFRFILRDHKAELTDEDRVNIKRLEDFVTHCGRTENVPSGQQMSFGDFMKLSTWDALSIGHVASEKVKTMSGSLHRFRPLPAESVYHIDRFVSKETLEEQIKVAKMTYGVPKSNNDQTGEGVTFEQDNDYYKYVQVSVDGRTLNVFGDNDMVFKLFNPKNFVDCNGYSVSMVEQAVNMVTNHMNVEGYNANYFTHGYAARGILHLKGTVTQNGLASFRRQFYNTISASNNAWRTPIVAGLDDVQWIPLGASSREMEYLQYNSHIMRSICAQFQIDPLELGLDYLTTANGRSSGAKESGQFKITYSRERGLIPILMFFEDFINNDIVPEIDKMFADKYEFKFFGYTDETAQTEVSLRQAQMSTFASMNDLLRWEEKKQIDLKIADVPLNQAFMAMCEKNMTRGEIREYLLGDEGASKRPELQYIPADPAYLSWQQLLMSKAQMKKQEEQQAQQMQQQQEMQQQQADVQGKQDKREQEKHDQEVAQTRGEHAALAVAAGKPPMNTLREAAKATGASAASNVGGTVVANPINVAAKLSGDNE